MCARARAGVHTHLHVPVLPHQEILHIDKTYRTKTHVQHARDIITVTHNLLFVIYVLAQLCLVRGKCYPFVVSAGAILQTKQAWIDGAVGC